ncbi:MAG: hypothetical protein J0H59_10040 [Comamonadaceae bacterium]|nr:hypothetical protein [Comamonadaceae bacterium]
MPTLLALAALLPWGAAQAARPMVTDDARIVDAKACQVESWVKRNQDSTEYWAQPACNFTGNLELSLGGARGKDDGGTQTTDIVLQAKTLFKPLEPDGWGWGLAVGHVRHPASGARSDLYAYLPASFALHGERLVLHTNIGWLHEREAGRHRMTWGLGTEAQWRESTWLIGEVFGQNQGRPFYQVGLRHWLVPGHVQVDATYGNRAGSSTQERWLSIGLRLLPPAFLP